MGALVLAASAGGLALSFWPGPYGWLAWLVYVPLIRTSLRSRDALRAFLWGWGFGTMTWCLGMYWMLHSIQGFMGKSGPASAVLFILLCAAHGLLFGLFGAGLRAAHPPLARFLGGRPGLALALAALSFGVTLEALFPTILPVHMADTQTWHLPLLQLLDVTGTAGLMWLIMGFNAALYLAVFPFSPRPGPRRFAPLALAAVLVAAGEAYGRRRIAEVDGLVADALARGRSLKVAVLQGEAAVDLSKGYFFDKGRHAVYTGLTDRALAEGPVDLVVWPESSYGRVLERTADGSAPAGDFVRRLREDVPQPVELLFGTREDAPAAAGRSRRYNVAVLSGPARELRGVVRKSRLFPFGEYVPFGRRLGLVRRLSPRTDRLSRGEEPSPVRAGPGAGSASLGVVICYEDMYSEAVRTLARKGAQVLVNITNEVWFSHGVAQEQHLMAIALRAVESRRFFLRAANTGISAVIDPVGRIRRRVEVGERGYIRDTVALMDCAPPQLRLGRFFYRLGIALAAAVLAAAAFQRTKGHPGTQPPS